MKQYLKFLLILFCFTFSPCFGSSVFAQNYSLPGWFFNMWIPDNFYSVDASMYGTVGKLTDGNTGSIIVSAMDNPQYRNLSPFTEQEVLNLFEMTKSQEKLMGNELVGYNLFYVSPNHTCVSAMYNGRDPKIAAYLYLHGQTIIICFRQAYNGGYQVSEIAKSIKSITCSYH